MSKKMIYCDGANDGTFPVKNSHHKGLHYKIIDEDAATPKGFRATMVASKTKKPTKAEMQAAEDEALMAEMEAEEAAKKAKEG